jgi:hypothetical protein
VALTREQLGAMKEDELRAEVLIPLFKAMAYRDVIHYHGGSGEQGKDIVMWKQGDFDERINYGVVAKAGKISGKAQGKGSAATVRFQIEQSFGSSYRDGVTAEDQLINVCIIVATGVISKEAHDSIKNAVKGSLADRNLRFINGDQLWELVEKHLPQSVVIDKLSSLRDVFESLSPHHRIVASVGEQIVLSPQPKYPGAEAADPLEIGLKLQYPNTPEGIAGRKELERHIATGSGITIPSTFVSELKVPDFLKPFIDAAKLSALEFGPRQSQRSVLTDIEITPLEGGSIIVRGIEFRTVQAGEEEITLDNAHQTTQWQFRLRLSYKDRKADFTFDGHTGPQNVKRELQMLKVWEALSKGCKFSLIASDSGMVAFEGNLSAIGTGPPQGLEEFFDQVLLIQTRTGVPITVPNRDITGEEIRSIYAFAAKLRTGTTTGTTNGVALTMNRAGAENMLQLKLEQFREGLTIANIRTWNVLDNQVRVGREIIFLKGLTFFESAKKKVRSLLDANRDADSFTIQLQSEAGAAEVTLMYPDSLRGADPKHILEFEALAHLMATKEEIADARN